MAKVTLKIDQDEIYEHLVVNNNKIEYLDVIDAQMVLECLPRVRKLFEGTSADRLCEEMITACKKVISIRDQKLKIQENLLRQFDQKP